MIIRAMKGKGLSGIKRLSLVFATALVILTGCGGNTGNTENTDKVADSSDYTASETIDDSSLTPVTADQLNEGEYEAGLQSSSSMFKVAKCILIVKDGSIKAKLHIASDSYLYMYSGTAKEAASDHKENYIGFEEDAEGGQIYTVPVEALDKALPYASFSRKKEQWYDRTLLFESSSLPDEAFKEARYKTAEELGLEDGFYHTDVKLEGGSGRASVESPALIEVKDKKAYATLKWSSDNYDYMIVEGKKYNAQIKDGASVFVIPVKGFGYRMPVVADTTAMSRPYEIDYTLYFDPDSMKEAEGAEGSASFDSMEAGSKIETSYAEGFEAYDLGNGIYRVDTGSDSYLLVPKEEEIPANIPEDMTVVRTPVETAYIASTSSMDFFSKLDALERVGYVSSEASKWMDENVRNLVEKGDIEYAGKYDAPDFEALLTGDADIAVENTMIYHSPETEEKLEELSIPVFVDMTSYEKDPRGRVEWIKVYGLLCDRYDEACEYFGLCCEKTEEIISKTGAGENAGTGDKESKKPKVVFFYISPKGHVGVRSPGDYVSKMIEMAGGSYAFSDIVTLDDNLSSSVDMSMEDFYLEGKDADILIYNSTLYGMPGSVEELVAETALLSEFKAVKEGRVYASNDNMFQATCETADMISDIGAIISGEDTDMRFFTKLK